MNKLIKSILRILGVLGVLILFLGCYPTISRKDNYILESCVSGEKLHKEMGAKYSPLNEVTTSEQFQKIIMRLRSHEKNIGVLKVYKIHGGFPMAANNGEDSIYLDAGLLEDDSNNRLEEGELAAVVAHEWGHIILKHRQKGIQNNSYYWTITMNPVLPNVRDLGGVHPALKNIKIIDWDAALWLHGLPGMLDTIFSKGIDYNKYYSSLQELKILPSYKEEGSISSLMNPVMTKKKDYPYNACLFSTTPEAEFEADCFAIDLLKKTDIAIENLVQALQKQLQFYQDLDDSEQQSLNFPVSHLTDRIHAIKTSCNTR